MTFKIPTARRIFEGTMIPSTKVAKKRKILIGGEYMPIAFCVWHLVFYCFWPAYRRRWKLENGARFEAAIVAYNEVRNARIKSK